MKLQKQILGLISLLLVFSGFLFNTIASDAPLIFKKDLLAHDESSNSVVASNITRKFFPPMVRTNPLVEEQGNWMEGPYWQHIPPLFAYVPFVPFMLDGQITIEVKRLSFAALIWLTGLLFIFTVYKFSKRLLATGAATIASILWILTPFTRELITGYAFGVSDIVLSFTVILAFGGILWYIRPEKFERLNYPWWKIVLICALAILPVLAKNLLGAIPGAIMIILIFKDFGFSKRFWQGLGAFVGVATLYYLPLYISSPETFKTEVLVAFFHNSDYEGWGRPWHYYLTNYLPQRYLFNWTWVFWLGSIASAVYLVYGKLERQTKILLGLSLLWFVWNLVAITFIESKIANFIFQSYLLIIFAIVFTVALWLRKFINTTLLYSKVVFTGIMVICLVFAGVSFVDLAKTSQAMRGNVYTYTTEREKFYQTGEELRDAGFTNKDLVIARVSDNDCWLRYSILFLTGAEAKALLEFNFGFDAEAVKEKYTRLSFIINKDNTFTHPDSGRVEMANFTRLDFDLSTMTVQEIELAIDLFVLHHTVYIEQDILRIKKDLTSCQWLVPDPILNAP
jgi:hypothetical protein